MKLYFIRHGQTNSNAQAVNQPTLGNDEPLNEAGVQQANELAEHLKNEKIDVIISSPFNRAVQTAEIVNKYHNLAIDIDDAWQEIQTNGYVDISTWNNLFNFDEKASVENTEPLAVFFKRIYGALDKLAAKYGDKTIAVVSHGGVQHALYAYANKLPLAGDMRISPMKNCEYRIYELD
ncbi:MAG TPA: histidine phosphatase family protein [Candidatus Saccharimonadales bacterium]|nr:histidine phosphatase family protein [Candidatus Saccharimonadales bacterium]